MLDVRRFRSDQGVKPAQRIPARLTGIERYSDELRALLRLTEPDGQFTPTAELSTGSGRIELDLSTAIDVPAERARLTKDLAAAQKELEQTGRKLANEQFLANAKPDGGQLDPGPQRSRRGRTAPDRGGAGRAAGRAVSGPRRSADGKADRPASRLPSGRTGAAAEAALLARWGEARSARPGIGSSGCWTCSASRSTAIGPST